MEYTTNYDLDKWLDESSLEVPSQESRRQKKRRRPPRKNRRPSKPDNYIGQRNNNHLLRIFTEK